MKVFGRLGLLSLVAWPGAVQAHSPVPGIEGFYTGLLHPVSTPAQLFVLLGLGLLVSSYPLAAVRWLLTVFPFATLVGAWVSDGLMDVDTWLFALAFAACVWVALLPGRVISLALGFTCVGGVLIGIVSMPEPGPAQDRIITLAGSLVGANLGLLYLFGAAFYVRERFQQVWVGVALRIAAAWIGAVSIVMLALRFAPEATAL